MKTLRLVQDLDVGELGGTVTWASEGDDFAVQERRPHLIHFEVKCLLERHVGLQDEFVLHGFHIHRWMPPASACSSHLLAGAKDACLRRCTISTLLLQDYLVYVVQNAGRSLVGTSPVGSNRPRP